MIMAELATAEIELSQPAHVRVSVDFDASKDQDKLVKGAIVLVKDGEAPTEGSSSQPVDFYMAVVQKAMDQSARKVNVSYINDDEGRETEQLMVFTETAPPLYGRVWLKDIVCMMPPLRVTRHEVQPENLQGQTIYEWHINVELIE